MKYTSVHRDLYPNATNILVKCEPTFFLTREKIRQRDLEPVIGVLKALGHLPTGSHDEGAIQPRLLIHAFSNGGCSQLTCLSRLIKARYPNWDAQPSTCALVLDSCPGMGDVNYTKRAVGSLLPNSSFRPIFDIFVTSIFFYYALLKQLFGTLNPLEALKCDLNQPDILPWTQKCTPRLYLSSKIDEIVPFYEIERHARDGKDAGFDVRMEVFDDTPHVSHARLQPQRYWTAVQETWDVADTQKTHDA
ncbi:hypothetical protein H0H92_007250 [Tricholoma furcatifolium]|nr:hypothetical protein H0H92_007250 [Tricholoma furcatifolium]